MSSICFRIALANRSSEALAAMKAAEEVKDTLEAENIPAQGVNPDNAIRNFSTGSSANLCGATYLDAQVKICGSAFEKL